MNLRVLAVCIGLVGGYALTTVAAKPDRLKGSKVAVCHFSDEVDSLGVVEPPHVIVISENALDAHLRNHGDCVVADTLQAGEPCSCEGR